MPFCRAFLLLSRWVWLFFVLYGVEVFAQSPAPEVARPSDVRMVIDISGSMKKNDPGNLRRPALDMLIQLLPKDSKAGVWSFGKNINLLVPHQKNGKSWSDKARKAAFKINSVGQFTNIGGALEEAAYDAANNDNSYQRHVILLTDGMVDIDRDKTINEKERQRIIDTVLPRYQQAGITLHTIALSDNADKELLDKLALATDGKSAIARTSDELMAVLLSVFDQAVPAEEAPFDGNSFIVDSSIEEFTALIFRQAGSADANMIAPDGTVYNKGSTDQYVNWYHDAAYDLITVTSPLEGQWRVDAEIEPQSRITVVSDLKLLVAPIPRNIGVNEEVQTTVAFQEEGNIVTRLEFLGLLDIDMDVRSPSGEVSSQRLSQGLLPEDGLYPAVLNQFSQEGEYIVDFTVDGKSFNRKYSHTISVRKPLAVKVEQKSNGSKPEFLVNVIPQIQKIDIGKTRIQGQLTDPEQQTQIVAFSTTADGNWQARITATQQGRYTLALMPYVLDKQGNTIPVILDPVVLENDSMAAPAPVEEPKPVIAAPADDTTNNNVINETPVQATPEEDPVVEEAIAEATVTEEDDSMMDYILYGAIGAVNLLIILIVAIIYRKLFKKKPVDDELEDDLLEEEPDSGEFTEPPMDEMAVEEIEDEDDIDPAPAASEIPVEESSSDEMDEAEDDEPDIALGMDDDDDINLDDDDPEVSLDDLSPESLDDDDVSDFDEDNNKP